MHTLENGINDPLLLRTGTPLGKILGHGLVDLDEGGLFVDDMELMLVGQLVVSSTQLTDSFIVLIHDGGVTMPVSIGSVVVTLEAEQDIFALPAGHLEVGGPDGVVRVAGPDQFTVVTEDVRGWLTRTVDAFRVAGKGAYEEIAFLYILSGGDGDVQPRGCQVRPRFELPVSGNERQAGNGGRQEQGKRAGAAALHLHGQDGKGSGPMLAS